MIMKWNKKNVERDKENDDEEFYNSVGDLSDIKKPLKSTEEAIDFVKNLPTISFNDIIILRIHHGLTYGTDFRRSPSESC